jgi:hypothetical protein
VTAAFPPTLPQIARLSYLPRVGAGVASIESAGILPPQQPYSLQVSSQVIKNLSDKFPVPEGFDYVQARSLFKHPKVLATEDIPELKWKDPDEEEVVRFMCTENGFSEDRIRKVRFARELRLTPL